MYRNRTRVAYICDRRKCEDCHPECDHTTDVGHAASFDRTGGDYWEARCDRGAEDVVIEYVRISDEMERLLIEMAGRLKGFCNTHTDCSGCTFYEDGCRLYDIPSEWEVEYAAD